MRRRNIVLHGGVPAGLISPPPALDPTVTRDRVPDGHAATDERRAVTALVTR